MHLDLETDGRAASAPRGDRKIIESAYAVHNTRPFALEPVYNLQIRSPDAVTDDLFPTPAPQGQYRRPTIFGDVDARPSHSGGGASATDRVVAGFRRAP